MRNVLCAYVKRNPTVGYCQGLNYVVAHLLRYMNEEETFWILCTIIECILPLDYYTVMTGVLIDQKIMGKVMEILMPILWAHCKKICIDPAIVAFQWFICLYSCKLQLDVRIFAY